MLNLTISDDIEICGELRLKEKAQIGSTLTCVENILDDIDCILAQVVAAFDDKFLDPWKLH